MPGVLYYALVPFVSKEPLSEAKLDTINGEAYNQVHVMVLDDHVEIVQAEQRLLERPPIHHHVSTRHEYCDQCMVNAQNRENVLLPGEEEEDDDE